MRQTWDPERYARNARFVSDLGCPVVELLRAAPGRAHPRPRLRRRRPDGEAGASGLRGRRRRRQRRADRGRASRGPRRARRRRRGARLRRASSTPCSATPRMHWMRAPTPSSTASGARSAGRPLRRRVRRPRLRAADRRRARRRAGRHAGIDGAPRTRGTSRPTPTTAPGSRRRGFAVRDHRAHPAPDAAARRRHRLARDLRRELHAGRCPRPSAPPSSRGPRSSSRPRCAMPRGTGRPTTCGCDSRRRSQPRAR